MRGKYKTVKQDLRNISATSVYEADMNFTVEQMVEKFKTDVNKRVDLSKDFKKCLLSQPVGRNYEIVYYPVYFYNTESELSWDTKRSKESDVYAVRHIVGSIKTTITTTHTKGGVSGSSEYGEVKTQHLELAVAGIDKSQTAKINNFRSIVLPVYEDELFFDNRENGKNAQSVAEISAKTKRGQSVEVVSYSAHIVLVPIARYVFEYKGKEYFFEMNLHNGKYVTKYRQKPFSAIINGLTKLLFLLMHGIVLLFPLMRSVYGIFIEGFKSPGVNVNALLFFGSMILMLFLQLGTFIIYSLGRPKPRSFAFERATSTLNPFKYLAVFKYLGFYAYFSVILAIVFGIFLFQ